MTYVELGLCSSRLAHFLRASRLRRLDRYPIFIENSTRYGVIRHPSYLGLHINALGWALAFRSGAGVLLTALIIPPLLERIRAEEGLLRAHFGSEYELYCQRTSRLIPGVY